MKISNFQFSIFKHGKKGAAALTTALLLGGIIVEIGLVGAFLFYLLNYEGCRYKVTQKPKTLKRCASGLS